MIDVSALVLYFVVMCITPGPNNVMVTASGATYGYRATLPHIVGIGLGATLQMILVALGLGLIFQRFPVIHTLLGFLGAAYLVYLAWKLSRADAMGSGESGRPFTVWQAMLFQAVNPKAWIMAVTTAAVFLPRDTPVFRMVFIVAALNMLVSFPCVSAWALFGSGMRGLLSRPTYRRAFNLSMSALLVVTAAMSLRG